MTKERRASEKKKREQKEKFFMFRLSKQNIIPI